MALAFTFDRCEKTRENKRVILECISGSTNRATATSLESYIKEARQFFDKRIEKMSSGIMLKGSNFETIINKNGKVEVKIVQPIFRDMREDKIEKMSNPSVDDEGKIYGITTDGESIIYKNMEKVRKSESKYDIDKFNFYKSENQHITYTQIREKVELGGLVTKFYHYLDWVFGSKDLENDVIEEVANIINTSFEIWDKNFDKLEYEIQKGSAEKITALVNQVKVEKVQIGSGARKMYEIYVDGMGHEVHYQGNERCIKVQVDEAVKEIEISHTYTNRVDILRGKELEKIKIPKMTKEISIYESFGKIRDIKDITNTSLKNFVYEHPIEYQVISNDWHNTKANKVETEFKEKNMFQDTKEVVVKNALTLSGLREWKPEYLKAENILISKSVLNTPKMEARRKMWIQHCRIENVKDIRGNREIELDTITINQKEINLYVDDIADVLLKKVKGLCEEPTVINI